MNQLIQVKPGQSFTQDNDKFTLVSWSGSFGICRDDSGDVYYLAPDLDVVILKEDGKLPEAPTMP